MDNIMKEIPLTQNKVALVDDEDFNWLNQYKWCALKTNYGTYMAVRADKQKTIFMHRLIMSAPRGMDIDHQNHNTLDNRKHNLRICTHMQNKQNGKSHKNSSSFYKGVSWHKNKKKWQAQIEKNYQSVHLGYFDNEIEAAKTYDQAAIKLFGEFANINF